ncbi:MAG: hypothetical protein V7731_23585 [Amphritea sp.]
MNNARTQNESHDHSAWPRDYNFRSSVAEQQELITQQTVSAKLKQHSHEMMDNSTNKLCATSTS